MNTAIVFGVLLADGRMDWPGRNQLMLALSEHMPVVLLEHSPTADRLVNLRRPRLEKVDKNLFVMHDAVALRSSRLGKRVARVSALVDGRWFRSAVRSAGFDDFVLWLTVNDPSLALGVPSDRLVYDCMDPNFLPASQERFDRQEFDIARRAEVVFASAGSLYDRMSAVNANTVLLPNAAPVAAERLAPAAHGALDVPAALRDLPRPVVGYLGTIDWRFDADHVLAAATALPEVTFALVGRVNADQESKIAALRDRPNVVFPGQVNTEEGDRYVRTFDVAIIPFIPGEMNDAINPVKMYMYLAGGLPVVSTGVAECRANPLVAAAENPQQFAALIAAALEGSDPGDVAARIEFAAANTWSQRAQVALEVLAEHRLVSIPDANDALITQTERTTTRRPTVALLRGEALNPYEMQAYAALTKEFSILAVGRRRPLHEVERVPVPVTLLHSLAEVGLATAVYRRLSRRFDLPGDPDRLFGLKAAVAGRDILHAAETVLPVSEQGAEIAQASQSALVLTCWETIPFRYDDDAVLAARKSKVKAATSMYLAVTSRAAAALTEEGVPANRIRVIPAAIDCTQFRPVEPSPRTRSEWGVPANAPLVLYVGRLIQEKGIVELVRAIARTERAAEVHLVCVGSGNQGERIGIAAGALGMAGRVHVRSGVSHGALTDIYATADIVVAPSLTTPYWEEQFGMVLGEAMACGRPLITTASGAIPEVVGDAAAVVSPYDVASLTAVLDELLADADRRKALGDAGRQRVESLYDVPVVAAQIASAYREILGL